MTRVEQVAELMRARERQGQRAEEALERAHIGVHEVVARTVTWVATYDHRGVNGLAETEDAAYEAAVAWVLAAAGVSTQVGIFSEFPSGWLR